LLSELEFLIFVTKYIFLNARSPITAQEPYTCLLADKLDDSVLMNNTVVEDNKVIK